MLVTALAAHITPEHEMFRDTCRRFFEKEVMPFHMKWEEDGVVPRELWRKAGEQGLLGEVSEGAYADLLLVDGNPLDDINLMADPEKNIATIMKNGVIYKDARN